MALGALGGLGDVFVGIGADISGFEAGLAKVNQKMDTLKGKLSKHSAAFKKSGLVMAGAAAAVGGISLKMAADFEGGMREVNTMMGLTEEGLTDMSKELRKVALETAKSPKELTGALYDIISASIPAGDAIEFLGVASRAAVAGVTDVKTAADGLTTVVNAFGLQASDADKVADQMFTTVKRGKTTFEQLSAALFNVAPLAAAADIEFKEIAAALATMTKQGVPTKIATTQLRAALQNILKPTEDGKAALQALGYESGQAMIASVGLKGTLEGMAGAAEGDMEMLVKLFGSIEAVQAVVALTGANAQSFTEDLEAMDKASEGAGATMDAYNEINKGAGRQLEKVKVQLEDTAIELGTALMPAILAVVKALSPFLKAIAGFMAKHPKLAAAIVGLTLVLGMLLLVLGFLPAIISGVTIAMAALNAVFLANPIGLVIIAIVALIAICLLIWKYWRQIWDFMKKWGVYLLGLPGLIIKHWDTLKGFFVGLWRGIKGLFDKAVDWMVKPFKIAINAIIALLNAPMKFLSGKKLFSISIPSWVPGIGGKGFELKLPTLPKIPSLQFGGIVPGPIGLPQLVVAHGGEQYLGVGAKARGGDINITLQAGAFMGTRGEARRFAAQIEDLINQNKRYGGYE